MMGRSHVLLGGAVYVALWRHPILTPLGALGAPLLGGARLVGLPVAVVLGASLLLATLSALGPDIDKRRSTIAHAGGWATGLAAWSVEHTLHHRGPLHSLLATLGVVLVGDALGRALGITGLGGVLGFGWAAHLLGDVATTRGIPLLWPARSHVHPPFRFATGTWQETMVLLGALALCAAWAAPGGASIGVP